MEYVELICKIVPFDEETKDIIITELMDYSFESFVDTDEGVNGYIPSKDFDFSKINEQELCNKPNFAISLSYNVIPDQNWNEVWEKNYFSPIIISDKCLIKGPFHEIDTKAEYTIVIEPKMSFGTGHHATTSQMIGAILELNMSGKKVLDMGCGTGVLAILSSMMGAAEIWAVDIDEWAYNNSIENAMKNNAENISVIRGDVKVLNNNTFDYIFANINRNILLEDVKHYATALKNKGKLIISGFYEEDVEILRVEAEKQGLKYQKQSAKNNWTVVVFDKM